MFSRDADKGMYRPLLLVTYALNYAVGGYEVGGYHLVNIALHATNAALLLWLGYLLSGRLLVGFLAGIMFAVYPLTTEPVNYISSRSDTLSAMFYLLGICLFVRVSKNGRSTLYVATVGALILGLLSKSTAITLPAVLLAYEYVYHCSFSLRLFCRRLFPWHAVYLLTTLSYIEVIRRNGFLLSSLERPVRDGATQLYTQMKAFGYYAKLLLWPWDLNVEHQFFEASSAATPSVILSVLLVCSLLFMMYRVLLARMKLPLFLGFWGVVSLLPTSIVPLNVMVNERRLYLASGALCIAIGCALARMIEPSYAYRSVRYMCLGALIAVLGSLSILRNSIWASDFSLWTDAVAKAPMMPRAHLYLGNAHKRVAVTTSDKDKVRYHWNAAAASYERAIKVKPNDILAVRSLNNLGSVNFELGNYALAETAYREALKLDPQYADALINVGNIYQQRALSLRDSDVGRPGLFQTAITYYRRALAIFPNHSAAYGNLGFAYFNIGELVQAEQAYRASISLNPRAYNTLNNLGNLYLWMGKNAIRQTKNAHDYFEQASGFFLRSFQINPAYEKSKRGFQIAEQLMRSVK